MSDVFVEPGTNAEPTATPSVTPAAATPAASAPQLATPVAPQGPATGPEGWVPSYRVRETREAAMREANEGFATREAGYKAELDQIRTQLHALVGVQPPQNPELTSVRNQFGQLYPGLAQLEDRAKDLMGLIDRAGDMESQNSHYWQKYGRETMDRLFEQASQSLGSPLTNEGKSALHAAFSGFVSSSPELSTRYANDPTLVDEYWKAFSSNFIDPVRRTAGATVVGRVAGNIPQDTPSGAPRVPGAPKPAGLEERAQLGWTQYQQQANR